MTVGEGVWCVGRGRVCGVWEGGGGGWCVCTQSLLEVTLEINCTRNSNK